MKPIFSLSHLTHPLDKQWIIEWYSSRNAYLVKPSCSAGHLNHIFRSAYGSNVVLVFCIPREGIQCQMWRRWQCKDITSPILQAHVRIYGRWDFIGCHFQKNTSALMPLCDTLQRVDISRKVVWVNICMEVFGWNWTLPSWNWRSQFRRHLVFRQGLQTLADRVSVEESVSKLSSTRFLALVVLIISSENDEIEYLHILSFRDTERTQAVEICAHVIQVHS